MTAKALELLLGPERRVVAGPNRKAIEDALDAVAQVEDGWATLSWSVNNYVTATPCGAPGFELEVELGTPDFRYRMSSGPVPLRQVILIFIAFALRKPRWMDAYEWEHVPLKEIDFSRAPDSL